MKLPKNKYTFYETYDNYIFKPTCIFVSFSAVEFVRNNSDNIHFDCVMFD